MEIKNSRLKEIDILYTLGAILAVFGHSHPNNWASFEGSIFYHCIVFIYTFHMALFFFVAGVLLANSRSIETKPFTVFIKNKAIKLLTPYAVLTLLAILPKGYLEHQSLEFLNIDFILRIFFNPRDNIWGHFWFLPVLFICYILFGFLKKMISKGTHSTQTWILAVCVLVFAFLLLYPPIQTEWFGLNDIFKFSFYMPLGMLLAPLYSKLSNRHSSLLVAVFSILFFAMGIVGYIFYYTNAVVRFVISLLMIFSLLGLANLLKNRGEKTFRFFSENVFTIYIYSWPFQSVALMLLEKIGCTWQICAPIMFVLGIVCPLALKTIYEKTKKINCRFLDLVLGIR